MTESKTLQTTDNQAAQPKLGQVRQAEESQASAAVQLVQRPAAGRKPLFRN